MDILFSKGNFITFTAVKLVHLGAIEVNVNEGDTFEYDGQTLRLGGREHNVPSIRGGIRAGWFVADASAPRVASPAPASAPQPPRRIVQTLDDDERTVGFATSEARNRAASGAYGANGARANIPAHDEGVIVGKVRIASKQHTVLSDSSSVNQEIRRLDNMTAKVTRAPVATGDVQEARSGNELEDILPEARSTGRPAPGPAGEGSDGTTAADRAEAARRARMAAVASAPAAPPVARDEIEAVSETAEDDVSGLFGDLIDTPDVDADAAQKPVAQARMTLAKLAVPGFEWDLAAPWQTRVRDALARRGDPVYLNAILAVETDIVKKHVSEGLRG
jgi:hypothetical protein